MKKSRAILGAVLGLALTVPLSPMTAEAAGGRWDQVDVKTRRYFVPDGQIEKQTTVLSSSEKLVNTATQTQRGAHIRSGADPVGAVTTRDVAAPAKDKVTVVPGAAEQIGNDWVEYETVKREKATERFYSQLENKYDLYVEQTRSAQTFQVTDKVRTVETWTDPVTKQTQQTVADSTQTRNEIRYSAWTDSNKQIRVDAGNHTRTWGPDLIFAKVPDEQRVAKRTSITPPGGMQAGWWLIDTETFRTFVAGNTPPSDAKQATEAKGNEIREGTGPALGGANSDWVLVNAETIRNFVKGSTPPKGSVAATPEQSQAISNPLSAGWLLSNSELIRYFVPGNTPPKDAQQASPEQKAAIDAGVTNDWVLVNVANLRNFLAGNVPPQDATRSKDPANYDPSGNGDWALENTQRFRFFVAIPGDFENPIPNRPVDPARELIKEEIVAHADKASTYDAPNEIKSWREGLLIKRTYPRYRLTPQTLVKTYQHWAQQLETYTTYENREIAVNLGGGSEMMNFQVPVKNYKWVPTKTHQTKEYTALEDDKKKIADIPMADLRASEITTLAEANGERPTSFQGDSGSGGKAALTAAKQREQMGANQVKASNIALTPQQIEEARRKAEEQARRELEEENRRKAEEEAQRKAEREAEAREEQERKAAEEAAAPKTYTFKVDASKHVIEEDDLKDKDAIKVSVAGPALEKGKVYVITATGTAKYTSTKHDVHWFTPNDASARRFKTLVVKGDKVEAVLPYGPGQGLTIAGSAYPGLELRFVFEDENEDDNVKGSGFDVTVTVTGAATEQPEEKPDKKAEKDALAKARDAAVGTWVDVKSKHRSVTMSAHNNDKKINVSMSGLWINETFNGLDFGATWSKKKGSNTFTGRHNADGTFTLQIDGWFLLIPVTETYTFKKQ